MYLSKVSVEWEHVKNPYCVHKALWRLFPGREHEDRSFLFRVEKINRGVDAAILMQSKFSPEQEAKGVSLIGLREYPQCWQEGQRLRFCLRANPVKAVVDKRKGTVEKNGKTYIRSARVPLVKEEDQQRWLEKRLLDCVELDTLIIQNEKPLYFRKKNMSSSGKVNTVLFNGVLHVSDAEAFSKIVNDGIGAAKSFGCGMLSLARV